MKAKEKNSIELVEVETVPEALEPGKFYYSKLYNSANHLCPCGCGFECSVPIKEGQWQILSNLPLTVTPSFLQRICKSHYVIQKGFTVLF